ncbi:MAG: hypothetical protein WBD99_14685 [Thermodesulfobacteriota bacterium]
MQKFFLNGLVTAFLVFLVYGVAQAQPNLTLPDELAILGGSVEVGLDFENNGEVTAAELDILFDDTIVSIDPDTDIEASAALDAAGFTLFPNVVGGTITLAIINLEDPAALIPNGEIVLMDFSADQVGLTDLMFSGVVLGDAGGMPVLVDTLTDGSIEVEAAPPAEINVTIEKDADTNRVDPDVPVLISYDIILEGVGEPGGVATDVIVTDALPDGAAFQAADSSPECEMLLGPPNSVECEVGTVDEGEIVVLTIVISITRESGDDIFNEALVDFLNGFGDPVENASNVVTVRVGGGGGGGDDGCALASSGNTSGIGSLGLFAVLLIPVFAIGLRRLIRKNCK